MSIPVASNYPASFDNDENLLIAHDGLRLILAEDYNPGDTKITVIPDSEIMPLFPSNGLITLTEQCSDVDKRAISFFYNSRTDNTFDGLELLPEFEGVIKPKKITNVTQNVMAPYHNNIKDAIIAIEEFLGTKGTVDLEPFGETMEGRINFLFRLVLKPRAWFSANKRIGLVPFEVIFSDQSFRLGAGCNSGEVTFEWNFGDNTISSISNTISSTSVVPISATNVVVQDLDGGTITKTYTEPGIYDVSLTVTNDFGTDTVIFPALINARIEAPLEATINFDAKATQNFTLGTPTDGPYIVVPTIRSSTTDIIDISIPSGENPNNSGYSYSGELLDSFDNPIDPIETYTWELGDDLIHNNDTFTRAAYSVGGLYDLNLRVDTRFGSYRITSYKNAIDIIEKTNLWLWNYLNPNMVHSSVGSVNSYEFGLLSETFKSNGASYTLSKNDSFLDETKEYNSEQLQEEFNRNNGFFRLGNTNSGNKFGKTLLFWASGRDFADSPSTETVNFITYNGFDDTYTTPDIDIVYRQWNWTDVQSSSQLCLLFGNDIESSTSGSSVTNQLKTTLTITGSEIGSVTPSNVLLTSSSYSNGADELKENSLSGYQNINTSPDYPHSIGYPDLGHLSVYRSATKGTTGFILRNDVLGPMLKIKNFYKTEGTIGSPFQTIKKLQDIVGTAKTEGELLALSGGVYFFNNSGAISQYNDSSGVWFTTTSSSNVSFRKLQDLNVSNYANENNSLLAASDKDHRAYLSYDYSPNSFIKFNEIDITFSALGYRPEGEQWLMGIF